MTPAVVRVHYPRRGELSPEGQGMTPAVVRVHYLRLLRVAATEYRKWRDTRDMLIAQAIEAGASRRTVERCSGVSHAHAGRIAKLRKGVPVKGRRYQLPRGPRA